MYRELPEQAAISWSGGKDSALALHRIKTSGKYNLVSLVSVVNTDYARVSIHYTRLELLRAQAKSLRLPIIQVSLRNGASNEEYEKALGAHLRKLREEGVTTVIYGDVYLEDVREYRERLHEKYGVACEFPNWGEDTSELSRALVTLGIKAVLCSVNLSTLSPDYVGRRYDATLIESLPKGVDPCGEKGEFHTFVFDSPDFFEPVHFQVGNHFERDGFAYVDLTPAPRV